MAGNSPKIINTMKPITPKTLYLERVKATYQGLREESRGREYIPPSFGGIFGQQALVSNPNVLEMIEFESQ